MFKFAHWDTFRTLVFILLIGGQLAAQPVQEMNAATLQQKIKKLGVLGSALYLAAHPDDENTGVLAYLANEKLVAAAYLSLTRGDGGQNLIGSEKGDRLGVLRTQELLAARRIDGAKQFFSRAIDFGYTKSLDEALDIWGKEAVLSDVVWIIRKFRPDVIITRFTPEIGGHGQHLASAKLAELAFSLAGDSTQFAGQLKYAQPWQPKRLVWNDWQTQRQQNQDDTSKMPGVDVGVFNALLGKSYTELAAESRSMHKCQGFGTSARRGSLPEYFQHTLGDPAKTDLFEGVDLTWSRVPGGEKMAPIFQQIHDEFQAENPAASLPLLIEASRKLSALPPHHYVTQKQAELREIIRGCAGLWLEAIVEDFTATPGARVPLKIKLINRSGYPVVLQGMHLPFSNSDSVLNTAAIINQPVEINTVLHVPVDAPFSHPYWLREKHTQGLFNVSDQSMIGLPEKPNVPRVQFHLKVANETFTFETPVLYRWTDPVKGERYRDLEITPPVTVNFEENLYVFPDNQRKTVHFTLKSFKTNISGKLILRMPSAWFASRTEFPFSFAEKDQELSFSIKIRPPATPMQKIMTAEIILNERSEPARSLVRINYDHIPIQTLFPPETVNLTRVRLKILGKNIGYIMGSGDDVPHALTQIGYNITLLSDEDLENVSLRRFDAIVTGVRAFNVRDRLKYTHSRLMTYVKNGGTLIVQYNTTKGLLTENIGPYPFKISHDRVTREDAPVEFLQFDHPVFRQPNQILQNDFKEWVQERGLYFASEWNSIYRPLLSSHDPGESAKKGGLLYAPYGKGHFVYTGYSFFRQLPAGVPGAYRLFVNLLSLGQSTP